MSEASHLLSVSLVVCRDRVTHIRDAGVVDRGGARRYLYSAELASGSASSLQREPIVLRLHGTHFVCLISHGLTK